MINFRIEVFEDKNGKWAVEIYANSDVLWRYAQIDTKYDAYLIGEAFVDGIEHIRSES